MSTTISVINATGSTVREIEIDESWLERERGKQAVHEAVTTYLSNRRAGTAATKTRTHVSGGGAKPWRQKGTGRARAGSNRSPIWRGGGIIFGPVPRSYRRKLNKKVRQLALRRSFTDCLDKGRLNVIDGLQLDGPRTKLLGDLLKGSGVQAKNLLIVVGDESNKDLVQAARNLDRVTFTSASRLNVYQIVRNDKVLITESGLQELGKRLA